MSGKRPAVTVKHLQDGNKEVTSLADIAFHHHHHHHFICPIIQQYAHLHEYDSRRAGEQGPVSVTDRRAE